MSERRPGEPGGTEPGPPAYIVLVSVHGLIRGHDLELGRDADTGGQTKYVVDLARALAAHPQVERVDLVTRRIVDARVDDDYALPIEDLGAGARIVRIDAGPEEYLAKETLWEHLDAFVDNLLAWLSAQGRMPDLVHGHYADAGYVGVRLASLLGVPLVHTGHSLGRDKRQRLLAAGLGQEEIDRVYNMDRRLDAEEDVLASADLVIASTRNEVEEQYAAYDYYQPERMRVIPPGTDLEQFRPPAADEPPPAFAGEVARFLREPTRPLILALSRADARKNIASLVEAYGTSPRLRELANLVIVAGNREDIADLEEGAQGVLTGLLLAIDAHDLYGLAAIPKAHAPEDVPAIYRMVAASGGVFVNPALTEPFGLTLLEAAASGVPLVATENGGPVDIIDACENGLLVDPLEPEAIASAIEAILSERETWERFSRNGIAGVRAHYSWAAHVERYLEAVAPLAALHEPVPTLRATPRRRRYQDRVVFTDIDQTLLGDRDGAARFAALVRENRRTMALGIATGRRLDSALAVLKRESVPLPDVLITSLGTEIHYASGLVRDEFWNEHIDHLWKPQSVRRALTDIEGLMPQRAAEQGRHKLSYHYDPTVAPTVEEITALLRSRELTANIVHSFGQYLDIVPARASKGLAVRYVAQRWGMPLERVLVAGGSGADDDMMRGNTLAVVVANRHHEELSGLAEHDRVYFSEAAHALGIVEAIEHYEFLANEAEAPAP